MAAYLRLDAEIWLYTLLIVSTTTAQQGYSVDKRLHDHGYAEEDSCSRKSTGNESTDQNCGAWDDERFCKDSQAANSLCEILPCLTRNETYRRGHACDGIFHCSDLTDECLCGGSGNADNPTTRHMCREVLSSTRGIVNNTQCPIGHFTCGDAASSNTTCKHASLICDGRGDCDDCSDELYCAGASKNLSRVCGYVTNSPSTSCAVQGGCFKCPSSEKYINWRRKFDDVRDCEDASDEWHDKFVYCSGSHRGIESRCLREESDRYFSTPLRTMRWPSFLVMQWVLGIPTVIANIAVAISTSKIILRWRLPSCPGLKNKPQTCNQYIKSKICNTILVFSLCVADLIFGLQMILLAASNFYLSGEYWKYDSAWQSSVMCDVIGSMCILATQASALTIVALAMFRLISVVRPFRPANVKHATIAAAGIWIISGFIMVVPLLHSVRSLEHYFLYAAEIRNNPQVDATVLERVDLVEYVRNVEVLNALSRGQDMAPKDALADKTFVELESNVDAINPNFTGWRYFGFYSRYSICMPPVFSSTSDPSWKFPVSVLCFNFAEYLLVMMSYIFVCRKAHPRKSIRRSTIVPDKPHYKSRNKEDSDMQRRILWLVVTDFMCWVPICTLSFITCLFPMAHAGGSMSLMVVIVLAELDSLVNPLLYSQQTREFAHSVLMFTVQGSLATFNKILKKTTPRIEPDSPPPETRTEIV